MKCFLFFFFYLYFTILFFVELECVYLYFTTKYGGNFFYLRYVRFSSPLSPPWLLVMLLLLLLLSCSSFSFCHLLFAFALFLCVVGSLCIRVIVIDIRKATFFIVRIYYCIHVNFETENVLGSCI